MTMFYDQFYQRYGVRQAAQLVAPRLAHLISLELPQKSLYHYVGEGPLDEGPASDEYLFRNVTRPIAMIHVTKLADARGMPRPVSMNIEQHIRQYHNRNRRFRLQRVLASALRDQIAPTVINYAWLARLYRYQRNTFTEYNRWWNINATVWKEIADLTKETDRNQFIELKLPKLLPGLTDLKIAAETLLEGVEATSVPMELRPALESWFAEPNAVNISLEAMNARTLRIFNTPESLMLLELWKWAGPQRKKSMISFIPEERLDRVNLIIEESGRWLVVNLGVLNKWREATEEELAANPQANADGISAGKMQARVLRMVMALFQARSDAAPQVTAAAQQQIEEVEAKAKETNPPALPEINAIKKEGEPAAVVNKPIDVTIAPKVGDASPKKAVDAEVTIPQGLTHQLQKLEPEDQAVEDPDLDASIERDLAELDRITQAYHRDQERQQEESLQVTQERTLEGSVMEAADRQADNGLLSAAEYRRIQALSVAYKNIPAPDGKSKLGDFIQIPPEALEIKESRAIVDNKHIVDKTMLKSSLHDFDRHYLKNIFHRDVASMVTHLQHAAVCVTGYEVERVETVLGSYDIHTVKVVPVEGSASTLRFRLPAIQDDSTYMANGVKYYLRKQVGDLPIRKVAPNKVTLTSYYGKLFITRSEKKANDYGEWLRNNIMVKGLAGNDERVTSIHPLNVFDREFDCPRLYSALAMGFREFTTPEFTFMLDHRMRDGAFGKENVERLEKDGARLIAYNSKREYLLVDKMDALYKVVGDTLEEYPSIEEALGLPLEKAPIDFAEIKVMGRTVPLAFVLGYELGLTQLCRLLKVQPRIVPAGQRLNLQAGEYPLIFQDETWVFTQDNKLATMVIAGMMEFSRNLRDYGSHEFDKRDVYLNLLEADGPAARYLREIDLLYQMFIDPITRDLLVKMKEPTDFRGLLIRAAQMILLDQHPDELDPKYMRVKGYERMAGAVYRELVGALRVHAGRPGKSKQPIELKPFAVWTAIQTDPAKGLVKDINPIQNLKEREAMTFSGTGGRGGRSMTRPTRIYHPNSKGVTSEGTVDSGDVGINVYTSADPQFNSVRGTANPYVDGQTGATALLSTSALVSPGIDGDDLRRANFAGIQHGHGIACSGYRASALRTGYEQVIAHRTSDLYATTAKQDGRVVSTNDHGIVVEYADGTKQGISLGRRYGKAEGLTVPHDVVTPLKEGDEFKNGDVIAYNPGFFQPDILNPKQVIWKAGMLVWTVLMESTMTLEDSSAISKKISEQLTTQVTKIKTIVVRFDQAIHKLVKAGQEVGSESILCIIEDAITQNNQLFDEESLDTLKVFSARTPLAGFKGKVERVEIYYHGDVEDMSPSLAEAVIASDKEMARRHKAVGGKVFTGQVDDGFRAEQNPLALDTLAIQVYITADVPAGVGDKGVFGNQLKTVYGQVLQAKWQTEDGQEVDAVFGAKSVGDRIVRSPYKIGTTTTLLHWTGQGAVAIYRGGTAK